MTSDVARQVVLPFVDLPTEERGYQFGLAPGTFDGTPEYEGSRTDTLLINAQGTIRRRSKPFVEQTHLKYGGDQPPGPQWANCMINVGGERHYATLTHPGTPRKGSVPLNRIKPRSLVHFDGPRRAFLTYDGQDLLRAGPAIFDLQGNWPEATYDEEGLVLGMCSIADLELFEVLRYDGVPIAFLPTEDACDLGLWTDHLVRLLHIVPASTSSPV